MANPLPMFSESNFFFDKQARIYFSFNLVPSIAPFLSSHHLRLPQTPIVIPHSNSKKKKVPKLQIKEIYSKGLYICTKRKLLHFLNLRSEILVQSVFEICGLCCDLVYLIFVDFDLLNSISLSQIYSLSHGCGFTFLLFVASQKPTTAPTKLATDGVGISTLWCAAVGI